MKTIKLKDKLFELYIPQAEIEDNIKKLAGQINEKYKNLENITFLCVLNGSFMFAAELLKNISFNCKVCFVKLQSYNGMKSCGDIRELIGVEKENVEGEHIVIVEDIIDTGNTIICLHDLLSKYNAKSVSVATMLFKPGVYDKDLEIEFRAMEIKNEFVVGYGLDYDLLGRNYKDIYIHKNGE